METEHPKMSVIILGGGSSLYVADTVSSALEQNAGVSVEILIGPDSLTQVSQTFLKQLESDNHVRIVPHDPGSSPNQELARLVTECRGQYIALLSCGDFWPGKTKLQRQVEYFEEHPQSSICFHRVKSIRADGSELSVNTNTDFPPTQTFGDLVQNQFLPVSSVAIRRNAVTPLPDWFAGLTIRDWPFFLLAALRGDIGFIDETLAVNRQKPEGPQKVADQIHKYRDLNLALRRVLRCTDINHRRTVELKLSEHHRLVSFEMDRRGRDHAADRHRRASFLYGGWHSKLPLRTKISHAIRPCRLLFFIAVVCFETARLPGRLAPLAAFMVTTIWRQPSWILRIGRAVINNGFRGLKRECRILNYLYVVGRQRYARWIHRFDTLTNDDRYAIKRRIETMQIKPQFSVIMPVYNSPELFLRQAIESVIEQLYPDWELCIVDDCSNEPHVQKILNEFQAKDIRIRCRSSEERGNISVASNAALKIASGEFTVFMDHDDVLAEHALYMVAEEINHNPQTQIVYSDQDRLDEQGRRVDPYFKTDWNPDLMLSHNLICHLSVFRTRLVHDVGGLREGFEGGQDYDLALRCIENTPENCIRHIPAILYHWRQVQGSVSVDSSTSTKSHEAGARAIQEHLARTQVSASVEIVTERGSPHYRVRFTLPEPPPVSVIIPTRDRLDLLKRCVEGLLHDTDYPHLEIMIIDNESREPATLEYFASLRSHNAVRILEYKGEFNYSSINNFAVRHATGDVICLLNNDTEIIHTDWLSEMVSHAMRDTVGAVGAKLLYPDDSIQHAGVLIGYGGLAGHTFSMLPVETPVQFGRTETMQNVSCVTAACLVLRKSVFDEVSGLDEKAFAVAYNDVDLCLKIASSGYRIVWTPYAQLYHHESASRGRSLTRKARARDRREGEALRQRWSKRIAADPNMNPNVSIDHTDYRPAFPPRVRRPWS